jgi:hypothetical protein
MLTVTFDTPFREASSLADTAAVAAIYDLGLAGRGFFLDTGSDRLRVSSIPAMRAQTDDNDEPGLGSLATIDVWRKQSRSWHEGAGQSSADEQTSSPYRFLSSKGIDPWTKWQMSLLPGTSVVNAQPDVVQSVVVASGSAYHLTGNEIWESADGINWNLLHTLSSTATSNLATDGVDLYVGTTVNVKKVTTAGVESVAFAVTDATVVGLSKGRVWMANTDLWWATPAAPTPTLAKAAPWGATEWTWTAIADGRRGTYAAGYAGDKSFVWRIPLKDDGTGLDAAVEAWAAPDGETIHSLAFYLGYVMLGTSAGVRFSLVDDSGDLTPGSYIPTSSPVLALEPQDRFCWFGWTDYDADSTGLGRVDLSVFTSPLTPAYASDLMTDGQGDVTSVATFAGKRLFTVAGVGAVLQADTLVASGTLAGSSWSFGIDDDKRAFGLDVSHEPLDGEVQLALSIAGFTSGVLVESSLQGSDGPAQPVQINPITAERFSVVLTLTAGTLAGPVVLSYKLLARPKPPMAQRFLLPILLAEVHERNGTSVRGDPFDDYLFLRSIWRAASPVILQWGGESFTVFPTEFEWVPYKRTAVGAGWSGTCLMELREVAR